MRDQNNVPFDDTESEDELISTITEIELGLKAIDESVPIQTPNIEWFENIILEQKMMTKKRLIKDLTIFFIMALLILSGVLYTLYHLTAVFFAIQFMVTAFIVVYSVTKYVKRVNET